MSEFERYSKREARRKLLEKVAQAAQALTDSLKTSDSAHKHQAIADLIRALSELDKTPAPPSAA